MPDLRGRSAREAAIAAARRGLAVELRGSGHVVSQSPEAGAEIEPGGTCVLTLGRGGGAAVRLGHSPRAAPRGRAQRRPRTRGRGRRPRLAPRRAGIALRGHPRPRHGREPLRGGRPPEGRRRRLLRGAALGRGGVGPRRGRPRGPRARCPPRSSGTPRARSTSWASPARTARRPPPTSSTRPSARPARRTGLLGTVQYRIGDRIAEATRTTPESSDLQALFRRWRDAGCRRAVLEVSSHSLVAQARPRPRVPGGRLHQPDPRPPRLPRGHGRLLRGQAPPLRALPAPGRPRRRQPRRRPRGGARGGEPRARSGPTPLENRDGRHRGRGRPALASTGPASRSHAPRAPLEVETPLLGALQRRERRWPRSGRGLALGAPRGRRRRGLAALKGVPGRMERVTAGQDFTVLVDYAHTDDALKKLLETVRASPAPARDHRLRLRRRPRPHQAPADGRGGGPALPTW